MRTQNASLRARPKNHERNVKAREPHLQIHVDVAPLETHLDFLSYKRTTLHQWRCYAEKIHCGWRVGGMMLRSGLKTGSMMDDSTPWTFWTISSEVFQFPTDRNHILQKQHGIDFFVFYTNNIAFTLLKQVFICFSLSISSIFISESAKRAFSLVMSTCS